MFYAYQKVLDPNAEAGRLFELGVGLGLTGVYRFQKRADFRSFFFPRSINGQNHPSTRTPSLAADGEFGSGEYSSDSEAS